MKLKLSILPVCIFAVLLAISTAVSGCLWIAIPSLAYQGYKYEHSKNESSNTAAKNRKAAQSSAADSTDSQLK